MLLFCGSATCSTIKISRLRLVETSYQISVSLAFSPSVDDFSQLANLKTETFVLLTGRHIETVIFL
jgi:hypothetical protein